MGPGKDTTTTTTRYIPLKTFPITAMIEQDGKSFRGIMIDGVTDFQHDYRTIIEVNEGRMSPIGRESRTSRRWKGIPTTRSRPRCRRSRESGARSWATRSSLTKTYLGPLLRVRQRRLRPRAPPPDQSAPGQLSRDLERGKERHRGTMDDPRRRLSGAVPPRAGDRQVPARQEEVAAFPCPSCPTSVRSNRMSCG